MRLIGTLAGMLVVGLGASLGGAAFAQAGANLDPAQIIAFLDKDGDGKVSFNEYMAFQQPRFATSDTDGDGVLSYREFKASLDPRAQKNAERSFKAFNPRGQTMNQEEFLSYHAYVFTTFVDTDKDGFMSAAEWGKLMKAPG